MSERQRPDGLVPATYATRPVALKGMTMPDFTLVTDTAHAGILRARLTEQGVRRLVEWDTMTDQERLDSHGACHDCGGPVGSRLTVTLDEEDRVHAVAEAACPACGDGS